MEIIVSEAVEEKAKEKQKEGGKEKSGTIVVQKSAEPPIKTREELAKIAGVSHDTVRKVEVIEKEGTEDPLEQAKRELHGD